MLSQPLKLHCNVVVCAKSIIDAITTSASTQCPCCEDAVNLVPSSVQPALDIIQCRLCNMQQGCTYEQVTMTHTSAKGLEFLKSKWLVK